VYKEQFAIANVWLWLAQQCPREIICNCWLNPELATAKLR